MGKIIKFPKRRRGRSKWTSAKAYGGSSRSWLPRWLRKGPSAPQPARFRTPRRSKSWAQAFREMRPLLLLIALVTLVVIWRSPELVPMPDLLKTEPVTVDTRFTRCDEGRTRACAVDGDTIRIGDERIRIMGIDTPELHARCQREAELADRATDELVAWLNKGPFVMRGRVDEPTDKYGRQLRELYRSEGGFHSYVGTHMIDAGLARSYYGEGRESWCD